MDSVKTLTLFCLNAAMNHHGYVWGGRGKLYNEQERDYLYKIYRTPAYNYTYYYTTQWNRWKNTVVYDCSGLFQAFRNIDQTAHGLYNSCISKTTFSKMSYLPGTLLFVYSSSSRKMVHVGLYIGCGLCVHCKSSISGVVVEDVRKRGWTHAGQALWLDYSGIKRSENDWVKRLQRELNKTCGKALIEDNIAGTKTLQATITLKKGKQGTVVKLVQERLNAFGCDCGREDGIAGLKFESAVRKFQRTYVRSSEKDIDGIVTAGNKTWQKLLDL